MTTAFPSLLLVSSLVLVAGCRPPKDAEIISSVETRATIGVNFPADTTRLQPAASPSSEAGTRALAAVIASHLAAVGNLRDDKSDGTHLDIVANEHPVGAAPWSVQNAFDQVRQRISSLHPSKVAAMTPAQFARLRAEAATAARNNKDPLLTPQEFVRVPRPISDEGHDRPYWVPPSEPSGLQGP
jgi:hypothetical protein